MNWKQTVEGSHTPKLHLKWFGEIPHCTEDQCPHYDGKRCSVMGFRPQTICEPAVASMGELLDRGSLERCGAKMGAHTCQLAKGHEFDIGSDGFAPWHREAPAGGDLSSPNSHSWDLDGSPCPGCVMNAK